MGALTAGAIGSPASYGELNARIEAATNQLRLMAAMRGPMCFPCAWERRWRSHQPRQLRHFSRRTSPLLHVPPGPRRKRRLPSG
mmetsp:Transcript_69572/g.157293  ORF Transcript_69572/g.157293 Transcript_69572/m.157293 type:complete len:84 (+) Transcript_69572:152-403(+)